MTKRTRYLPSVYSAHRGRDQEPLIRLRQVFKIYHTGGIEFIALDGIDVDLYAGEFIGVVGRSGSGKSTLVNMITGIDRPSAGTVSVGETVISGLGESSMARWRCRNLGIVFQFYQLLPTLTLIENVMLPMDLAGDLTFLEREKRAMELLAAVGIDDAADELPDTVSGGQQQSAAVARALANDPPVLIADEPTGNLDARSAERVFALFEQLAAGGKTVIVVTHDMDLASRTGRILSLDDGHLVRPSLD